MLVYNFEISNGEKVFINNGVISYMFDSFKWIKTFNRLRMKRNKGLFYRGSTYIEKESIDKIKEVVCAWIELLCEASEEFILLGFFNRELDDYERWKCNKKQVIESLKKLIILCDKARKNNKIIKGHNHYFFVFLHQFINKII